MMSLVYLRSGKVFFVRFWKLLLTVSYSMGVTKYDVIPDIFRHAIMSLLNYHQLYCAVCTVISNMYTT